VNTLSLDLALTIARIVFLVLLYVFVLFVFRALIAEAAIGLAPRYRRRGQQEQAAATPPSPEPTPPPVAVSVAPERARVAPRAASASRLTVVETFSPRELPVGTAFPLTAASTIGRGPHNTAIVGDPYASLDHAIIVARGGQWHLRDRGSTNGTLLNGAPVVQEVRLQDADRIGIGSTVLRFSE